MTKHSAKQNEAQQMPEAKKSSRGVVGTVISCKMNKTVVVQVMRLVKHQLYGKFMRHYSKMYVHDAESQCRNGDIVKIQETRPISKTKRWTVLEIIRRPEQVAGVSEQESEGITGA